MMKQLAGTTISHYQILEEVGRGGMGMVYKAEDTRLKRSVALKFLPSDLTREREAKERFVHEAQAASALDHPNIGTIYEIDETDDGQMFIAMAYYEGETLKKAIEKGPLSVEEAIDNALQVAQGLAKAHEKGIVHRDIKPANIIVTTDGMAKIVDFGLARLAGQTKVTKTGTTVGTAAYMSPEQARGGAVDYRTDIWSLGVILYEMLTGQLPFKGEYEQAVLYGILNEEPEPITSIQSNVPVLLERIVDKALEKSPEKRYQRAEEMVRELEILRKEVELGRAKRRLIKVRLPRKKRRYLYGGVFAILVAIIVARLFYSTGIPETIDSVAVLPLLNLSGDPEQEYFADGMTEGLITDLGKVRALRVINRRSVMRYKQADTPLPDIARELNVKALLVGTVLRAGERVRVTAQLVNAATEEILWSESYERDLRDVLSLQSELASVIVREIQIKLSPQEETRLAGARPVNPETYEAYLKGMFYWYRLTPQDLETALQYFELALEKDPNYALAYTGIAMVWGARQFLGLVPPREATPRAKAAALKALELDSTLEEAHFVLATCRTWVDWDWEGGETEFRRAIELNPNYALARAHYSVLLRVMRRPEEAMTQIERALELDPFNHLFQTQYGGYLLFVGRYDDAIVQFRNALRTAPNFGPAHVQLWGAFHQKRMYDEALAQAQNFASARGDREVEEALARGYAKGGYREAMHRAAETLAARSGTTYVAPHSVARWYARAGENDRALKWLERAYEARDPQMVFLGRPDWDSLRDDPRFQDLLRRMNLPD